jgi:hypothetical protein
MTKKVTFIRRIGIFVWLPIQRLHSCTMITFGTFDKPLCS